MTLASNSGLARRLQQQRAHSEVHLGEPLKLPFARILQEVRTVQVSQAYRLLVTTGACALTVGQQEELYLSTIQGLERRDLEVIVRSFHQLILDMEDRPYTDLLGPLYMEIGHKLDKQASGEFFTPQSVALLMARMQVGGNAAADFPTDGPLTCNEPACGTGGMVLALTQALAEQGISALHTRWTVQDLSTTSCYGAFINLTLWGIPARVICGNSLSDDVRWAWTNPMWGQACALPAKPTQEELDQTERLHGLMRQFLTSTDRPTPTPAPAPVTRPRQVVQGGLFD